MEENRNNATTNGCVENEPFETVQINVNDFAFLAKGTHCGR